MPLTRPALIRPLLTRRSLLAVHMTGLYLGFFQLVQ